MAPSKKPRKRPFKKTRRAKSMRLTIALKKSKKIEGEEGTDKEVIKESKDDDDEFRVGDDMMDPEVMVKCEMELGEDEVDPLAPDPVWFKQEKEEEEVDPTLIGKDSKLNLETCYGDRSPHVCNEYEEKESFMFLETEIDIKEESFFDEKPGKDLFETGKQDIDEPSGSILSGLLQHDKAKTQESEFVDPADIQMLPHRCLFCPFRAATTYHLKLHLKSHIGERLYRCAQCTFCTRDKDLLGAHLDKQHPKSKVKTCSLCSFQAPNAYRLKLHMKASHTDVEKSLKCHICSYTARSARFLKLHLVNHRQFKCEHCSFKTVGFTSLRKHMRVHTVKEFKCDLCPYTGRTAVCLEKHMVQHGEGDRRVHPCDLCPYRTWCLARLKRHALTHLDYKPIKCPQCPLSFRTEYNLRKHSVQHSNDKPFKCAHCEYSAARKCRLILHLRTHGGEKRLKCSQCEYRCHTGTHLRRHEAVHSGEKPYLCNYCGYRCSQGTNLGSHLRRRHGELKPPQS